MDFEEYKLEGKTLIGINSTVAMRDVIDPIATLVTNILKSGSKVDVVFFGTDIIKFEPDVKKLEPKQIEAQIKLHLSSPTAEPLFVMQHAVQQSKTYNRFIIFSDIGAWVEKAYSMSINDWFRKYVKFFNIESYVYAIDVRNPDVKDTTPEDRVFNIGGFPSDLLGFIRDKESNK